jgi:peroxiredoxin
MKKTLFLFCCILAFTSCSKDKVKISGVISNAENSMIHLDEVDVYNTIPGDSIKLKKNGRFSFTIPAGIPSFYQLRLSPDKIIVLFPKPGDKIKISADANKLVSSLNIEGSHDTEQITKLIKMLNETRIQLDSIALLYEKAPDDSMKGILNRNYQETLDKHRKNSIAYLLTNYNSLSSVYALYQQYQPGYYVFYKTADLQFFKIISDSLSKYHPKSRHVEALRAYTNNLIKDYNSQLLMRKANTSVVSLPPLRLPDGSGDSISLQSLKGKVVLLSFWTSESQLCVGQNLELKKIYDKYRGKGFEIYQVSLDNSFDAWQKAVRFDELPWISVIDYSTSNPKSAGNYNVTQVPANYLINRDNSTVMGKNLSTRQIQDKLQELFN